MARIPHSFVRGFVTYILGLSKDNINMLFMYIFKIKSFRDQDTNIVQYYNLRCFS